MLKEIFAFTCICLILKGFQLVYSADFSSSLGAEIKAPFPSNCKMYETSVDSLNALKCFSNIYDVELIGLPNKSYTHKTFCPPSPHFALFYYNLISRKNKNGLFNVSVCKQKHASVSTTFKLYCEEMLLKDINCEDIYLHNEETFGTDFITSSPTTTTTPSPEETSIITTGATKTPEIENIRKYSNYYEGCNQWECRFNILLAIIITVCVTGAVTTTIVCLYFKHEKKRNQKFLAKIKRSYDFSRNPDVESYKYVGTSEQRGIPNQGLLGTEQSNSQDG